MKRNLHKSKTLPPLMASKYSISNYKSFLILVLWDCKLIIAAPECHYYDFHWPNALEPLQGKTH